MQFEIKSDIQTLSQWLPNFVELVGSARWKKRIKHLQQEWQDSPFRSKIVGDYHWLELEIDAVKQNTTLVLLQMTHMVSFDE